MFKVMENIVKATRYHYQFISLTVRKFVIKVWITSGMKLVEDFIGTVECIEFYKINMIVSFDG